MAEVSRRLVQTQRVLSGESRGVLQAEPRKDRHFFLTSRAHVVRACRQTSTAPGEGRPRRRAEGTPRWCWWGFAADLWASGSLRGISDSGV